MKLGVVGHGQEKFTKRTEGLATQAIINAVLRYGPTHIVSGHSPLGGVDLYAEQVAERLGVPTIIHAPRYHTWSGPGGYKERNLAIARDSDLVLCVVVSDFPPKFNGMRFPYCYHCKGRNPQHIKSGGCWTAWRCKDHQWSIIT